VADPPLAPRLSALAGLRVVLALAGAAVVLWPAEGGWPLPRTMPEWLGVVGGFSFALNNVMLRREAHRSEAARALAMFAGGTLVAGALALALGAQGVVAPLPALAGGWAAGAFGLALWFLLANLALQYGASRLPASATAVVMVSEVVFASASAVALGAGRLDPALLLGGIVIAALLAARGLRRHRRPRRHDGRHARRLRARAGGVAGRDRPATRAARLHRAHRGQGLAPPAHRGAAPPGQPMTRRCSDDRLWAAYQRHYLAINGQPRPSTRAWSKG
jgi:hypothetical protein